MEQQINLQDLTVSELEAFAYRLIVQREQANRNLTVIEQEIQLRTKTKMEQGKVVEILPKSD